MNGSENNKKFELRIYTQKELISLYGIPRRTFYRWLLPYRKELMLEERKKYLTIKQVAFIIAKFGAPGGMELEG